MMEEPLNDQKLKFKKFVKEHPELITDMKKHDHTWKDLFEAYQLFGEEADIWKMYNRPTKSKGFDVKDTLKKFSDYLQNMDGESLKQNLALAEGLLTDLQGFIKTKGPEKPVEKNQPGPQQQYPYNQQWYQRPPQPPVRPR